MSKSQTHTRRADELVKITGRYCTSHIFYEDLYRAVLEDVQYHYSYLDDIDEQVRERFETLTEQMKQAQGITELKAENGLKWTQKMNNIRACAMEIVNTEIIYA